MTPLYRSERATLYLGDCRDVAELIEPKSVGLMVTDPPYGMRWQSGFRAGAFAEIVGDDGTLDVPGVLAMFMRSLLDNRHVYIFGYRPDEVDTALSLASACELIWDKSGAGLGDLELPWGPAHERITFGAHWPSVAHRARGRGGLSAKLRKGSVLRVGRPRGTGVVRHPTEKPVELISQLIESSSLRGDIVLDPFAGSGSTLVAAILLGRRAIGCEIDTEHASTIVDRLRVAERLADQMESV